MATSQLEDEGMKSSDSESDDENMEHDLSIDSADHKVDKDDDDDDDVDSDASESDDEALNPRNEELELQIRNDPYVYDNHIELITALRTDGQLEKLRVARENMHKYHPLSEQLWLDWLNDEVKLLSPDTEDDHIYKLFDRATEDYLSVPVWLEYVQFSIRGMGTDLGMQRCRDIFEKALISVGLHVSKGSHVWDAYRELEIAILGGMNPDLSDSRAKDEAVTTQMNRVSTLFRRQLSVPLLNMEQTWSEYMEWADDNGTDDNGNSLQNTYRQTLRKLRSIEPFENQLVLDSRHTFMVYNRYLDFEIEKGEPSRVLCLFERAIKDNCLEPELWIKYLSYLDEHHTLDSRNLAVYDRATRNCAWSVQIWLQYMRAMERHKKPHDDLKTLFEQALSAGFNEPVPFLLLWTGYNDYLRRRIDWKCEHEKELELFRSSIERGIQHLHQLFGNDGDPMCTLNQFWASIEARYCHNMIKSREIWNEIMTRGHGNQAKMWLEYLNLERCYGDVKHCRKILHRGVNSVTDYPEVICEAYLNFEREDGSLADYDLAFKKTKAQLDRIEERRQEQKAKELLHKRNKTSRKKLQFNSNISPAKGQRDTKPEKGLKRKHEHAENVVDQPVPKAVKTEEGFKVPAPPAPVKEAAHQKTKMDCAPPGYIPKSVDIHAEPVANEKEEHGHVEKDLFQPDCTVFVSNLDYGVTEERLKQMFEKCGKIKLVKLATVRGQSRGFAYVEFADRSNVPSALLLDRELLDTRPMFVSCYKQKAQFKYQTGLEKSKLFVSNLPPTCTKEALETIFAKYGEIRAVRIVTNRAGVSKGLAYVEYVRAEDATSAILKTDGMVIGDQPISVAISNPPARKPKDEVKTSEFTPTLGMGKKDSGRSKAHTMIAFTPRSVVRQTQTNSKLRKPTIGTSSGDDTAGTKTEGMKSNADFRNLLLKK